MKISNLSKLIAAGVLSASVAVVPFDMPASAQSNTGTGTGTGTTTDTTTTTTPTQGVDNTNRDDGFDWGWLGLLGLTGLAGLIPLVSRKNLPVTVILMKPVLLLIVLKAKRILR